MQFQSRGPNIPERLLQSHEEGNVVFFCGAGISFAAGLPSFGTLTKQLFERLQPVPNPVQRSALAADRYDVAINLLIADHVGGRRAVRDAVYDLLAPDVARNGATATHEALLALGRDRSGSVRLVTTNFDRLFECVIREKQLPISSYVAPYLPQPKQRWDGLVYLHGLLPAGGLDAGSDSLVIGSGDFGLAYLTERWAARFVSDLFMNFSVCFVGYSLDDPVLRYMTDAIAADRRYGESPPVMFSFAACGDPADEDIASEWKAKGVTPIAYDSRDDHVLLHDCLHTWAGIYRDGLLGKERVVAELADTLPTRSTEQDEHVGRMLWALGDPTGLPAKRFAEHEPVPSLDWLEVLSDPRYGHDDLRRFGFGRERGPHQDIHFSFVDRPVSDAARTRASLVANQSPWPHLDADVTQIGRWLVRHLDNPKLALWVADRGGVLHPAFARQVRAVLDDPTVSVSKATRTLWSVILAGRVRGRSSRLEIYDWRRRLEQAGLTTAARLELKDVLAPKLLLRERFDQFAARPLSGTLEKTTDLVECELVLATEHVRSALQGLAESGPWVRALSNLTGDLTALLHDALDLALEVGLVGQMSDLTFMAQPSISEHEQNHDLNEWTVLITLCRDAWSALADRTPARALHVASGWMQLPYPVFKRLAYFAATRRNVVPTETACQWLSSDNSWWLWSVETQREALLLIASIVTRDAGKWQPAIEQMLLAGPPQLMFESSEETSRVSAAKDHAMWVRLLRVAESGTSPCAEVATRLEKLWAKHPEFPYKLREQDDFPVWMGDVEWGSTRRIPSNRSQLTSWLRDHPSEDRPWEDDWFERCREDTATTMAALCELAQGGTFLADRWQTALNAWSTSDRAVRTWNRMAPVFALAPPNFVAAIANGLSLWLTSVARGIQRHSDTFLRLCREVVGLDHENVVEGSPMQQAANHPIGRVTEALLQWWLRTPVEDNQGLPDEIRSLFTQICEATDAQYVHGRVVLAAYAILLFRVDEEWVKQCLLPRFDWHRSPSEARAAWDGFLHTGRLNWRFLEEAKMNFLEASNRYDQLGDNAERYAALLTHVAVRRGDTFEHQELVEAFRRLPESGLAAAARALAQALRATEEQRAEFWTNRVVPFLTAIWPSSMSVATPAVAAQLAEVCIDAGDSFEAAVGLLRAWLGPTEHVGYLVHRLAESGLCASRPLAALEFLGPQVDSGGYWRPNDLRACLEAIKAARPQTADDPRLATLCETLRQSEG